MLCILYVNAIAALLSISALMLDRATPAGSARRRWIWTAAIALGVLVPPVYQANHVSSVTDLLQAQAAGDGIGNLLANSPLSVFHPEWWQKTRGYGATITEFWLIFSATLVIWGVATAIRIGVLLSRRTVRLCAQLTVCECSSPTPLDLQLSGYFPHA